MTTTAITVSTPLRISLGGGGCDLPEYYREHGADVLAAAIDRRMTVAVSYGDGPGRTDPRVGLLAAHLGRPVHVRVRCPVPPGSGLGGSGALTVALVAAARVLGGTAELNPLAIGHQAFAWERWELGEPVGFQDQMASAFGSVTRMTAGRSDPITARRCDDLAPALARMLGTSIRLFRTDRSRSAADQLKLFASRVGGDSRCHELADTEEVVAAIRHRDGARFGELMRRRWARKVDLNPAAEWPEISAAIADALAAGATGAKVVGAGGGGWLMVAGPETAMPAVARLLTRRHRLAEDAFCVDDNGVTIDERKTPCRTR